MIRKFLVLLLILGFSLTALSTALAGDETVNRNIFTGKEYDENTGLIYFGARYYDPDTGRFITQDEYLGEIGTPPSLNRYLYAYGNPMVYMDLHGYETVQVENGDTIWSISKKKNADVESVKSINKQLGNIDNPDKIKPGLKIWIPEEGDEGRTLGRKEIIERDIPAVWKVASNPKADSGKPFYELDFMSKVEKNTKTIDKESKAQKVDPTLVKSIMYMETTHGYYDIVMQPFDANKTILPMNISSEGWKGLGYTREQLKDPETNVKAGVLLIKRIAARVQPSREKEISSVYWDLGSTKVNNYGARVGEIYKQKPWEPKLTRESSSGGVEFVAP